MGLCILNPDCCIKLTSVLTELKMIMKMKIIKEEMMVIWKSVHLLHKYYEKNVRRGGKKRVWEKSQKSIDSVYISEKASWYLLTLRVEY